MRISWIRRSKKAMVSYLVALFMSKSAWLVIKEVRDMRLLAIAVIGLVIVTDSSTLLVSPVISTTDETADVARELCSRLALLLTGVALSTIVCEFQLPREALLDSG